MHRLRRGTMELLDDGNIKRHLYPIELSGMMKKVFYLHSSKQYPVATWLLSI